MESLSEAHTEQLALIHLKHSPKIRLISRSHTFNKPLLPLSSYLREEEDKDVSILLAGIVWAFCKCVHTGDSALRGRGPWDHLEKADAPGKLPPVPHGLGLLPPQLLACPSVS